MAMRSLRCACRPSQSWPATSSRDDAARSQPPPLVGHPSPNPDPSTPGYFLFEAQTPGSVPGDVGGEQWVRYSDKATKTFKLNVERQNGRAAMLGVFGCILHELVGVDALYPTGGMDGAAPPTVF